MALKDVKEMTVESVKTGLGASLGVHLRLIPKYGTTMALDAILGHVLKLVKDAADKK